MKYFNASVCSAALIIITSNVFATVQETSFCPPVDMIKNLVFTQIKYKTAFINWDLMSDPFDYQGREWNVMFGYSGYDIKDPTEALEEGNRIFKNITLDKPMKVLERSIIMCSYPSRCGYSVTAISPANE